MENIERKQLLGQAELPVRPFLKVDGTTNVNEIVITAAGFHDAFAREREFRRLARTVNTVADDDDDVDAVRNMIAEEINEHCAAVGYGVEFTYHNIVRAMTTSAGIESTVTGVTGDYAFTVNDYKQLSRIIDVHYDAFFSPCIDAYLVANAAAYVKMRMFSINIKTIDLNYCLSVAQRCGYTVQSVLPPGDQPATQCATIDVIFEQCGELVGKPLMLDNIPISSFAHLSEVIDA